EIGKKIGATLLSRESRHSPLTKLFMTELKRVTNSLKFEKNYSENVSWKIFL
ncbi:MAG: hypothetical protein ACI8WP_001096, partial [Flavobacteriaceae bacterium]